jgi:hypothetical protein
MHTEAPPTVKRTLEQWIKGTIETLDRNDHNLWDQLILGFPHSGLREIWNALVENQRLLSSPESISLCSK